MGKHRWPTTGDPWEPPLQAAMALRPGTITGRGPGLRADEHALDEDATDVGPDQEAAGARPDQHAAEAAAGPAGAPVPWAARDAHAEPAELPRVQWRVARSAALVFLGVALAVGAALFLVRSSEPSAAAVTVQLDAERRDSPDGEAADAGTGHSGPPPEGAGEGAATGAAPVVGSPAEAPAEVPAGGQSEGVAGARGVVVIYVTGAVASPGVVTVPAGTRLFEILEHAGGALPEADLEGINLAATPSDGQHIHLLAVGEEPRPGQAEAIGPAPPPEAAPRTGDATAGTTDRTGGPAGLLDINTATLAEIESLPRVGPVLGQRIIDWRDEHGPFARASDIDAVPGIGPALLEGILPLVSVR